MNIDTTNNDNNNTSINSSISNNNSNNSSNDNDQINQNKKNFVSQRYNNFQQNNSNNNDNKYQRYGRDNDNKDFKRYRKPSHSEEGNKQNVVPNSSSSLFSSALSGPLSSTATSSMNHINSEFGPSKQLSNIISQVQSLSVSKERNSKNSSHHGNHNISPSMSSRSISKSINTNTNRSDKKRSQLHVSTSPIISTFPLDSSTTTTILSSHSAENDGKLFIGGLSPRTTKESLEHAFSNIAGCPVKEASVMLDKQSSRSRCFGFIKFEDLSIAKNLVGQSYNIDGHNVEIKWAVPENSSSSSSSSSSNHENTNIVSSLPNQKHNQPTIPLVSRTDSINSNLSIGESVPSSPASLERTDSSSPFFSYPYSMGISVNDSFDSQNDPPSNPLKIFVGGLASQVTDDILREYFSTFGQVLEACVMFDRETTRSRGFGFVSFATNEAVEAALQVSSHTICDKWVEIKRAETREAIARKSRTNSFGSNGSIQSGGSLYNSGSASSLGSDGKRRTSPNMFGIHRHGFVGGGYVHNEFLNSNISASQILHAYSPFPINPTTRSLSMKNTNKSSTPKIQTNETTNSSSTDTSTTTTQDQVQHQQEIEQNSTSSINTENSHNATHSYPINTAAYYPYPGMNFYPGVTQQALYPGFYYPQPLPGNMMDATMFYPPNMGYYAPVSDQSENEATIVAPLGWIPLPQPPIFIQQTDGSISQNPTSHGIQMIPPEYLQYYPMHPQFSNVIPQSIPSQQQNSTLPSTIDSEKESNPSQTLHSDNIEKEIKESIISTEIEKR